MIDHKRYRKLTSSVEIVKALKQDTEMVFGKKIQLTHLKTEVYRREPFVIIQALTKLVYVRKHCGPFSFAEILMAQRYDLDLAFYELPKHKQWNRTAYAKMLEGSHYSVLGDKPLVRRIWIKIPFFRVPALHKRIQANDLALHHYESVNKSDYPMTAEDIDIEKAYMALEQRRNKYAMKKQDEILEKYPYHDLETGKRKYEL